jgi:6,7-dimethyl-8-ribityllumazine synthase
MPKIIDVDKAEVGGRYALVVSRFNEFITEPLLDGALRTLRRHGIDTDDATVAWVPGCYEVPLACMKLAQTGDFDAVIALGCVIRGGTPHFEYVSHAVTEGVNEVVLRTGLPVAFGVLTTDTVEQAKERADPHGHNKGEEAALAAIEMVGVVQSIEEG